MGKAAAELPDALDPADTAETASSVDVDELLAQMAGEEIDRLLSEADDPHQAKPKRESAAAPTPAPATGDPTPVEPTPPATPAPAVQTSPAPADEGLARQLDELFSAMTDDSAAPAAEPAPNAAVAAPSPPPSPAASETPAANASAPAGDPLAKQLDDLFAQLEGGEAPAEPAPAPIAATPLPPASPSPDAVLDAALGMSSPAASEEQVATSPQERSALDAPLPSIEEEPTAPSIEEALAEAPAAATEDDEAERLPWYLKPLEWINAPLDALPDPMRELIGKLGLLTFFNASAVLVYVFLFRKHHH